MSFPVSLNFISAAFFHYTLWLRADFPACAAPACSSELVCMTLNPQGTARNICLFLYFFAVD